MDIRRPILAVLLTVIASRAHAQFGVSAGASVPRGDLGGRDAIGLHIAAMAQDIAVTDNRGFRIEGAYHHFVRKGTIQHITERVFYGGVSLVLHPIGVRRTLPYLVGGVGAYHTNSSPRPYGAVSTTDPGYSVGGGVQFTAWGQKSFGEIRLHKTLVEPSAGMVAITAGRLF